MVSLCLLAAHLVSGEDIVVKTEKGSVKGAKKDIDNGKFYLQFLGIKYAKSPTGPLRFMVSGRQVLNTNRINEKEPNILAMQLSRKNLFP